MTAAASPIEGLPTKVGPLRRVVQVLFGLTLFAVALPRALALPVAGTLVQVSDLLCLVTAIVWSASVLRGEIQVGWHRAYLALGGYIAVASVSLGVSPDPKHGAVKLLALAYLTTMAVITRSLIDDLSGFRVVVGAWLAGWGLTVATFVGTTLLFYLGIKTQDQNPLLTGYYNMPVGPYPRITGLFLNPNMAANYLIVGTFVFLAAHPTLPAAIRKWSPWIVGLACIGTLFSLSTGFGGLMLALGIWWWVAGKRLGRQHKVRDGALVLAGLGAAVGLALATILLLVPAGHGDVRIGPVDLQMAKSGRVVAWKGALDTLLEHPVLGRGYGSLVSWVDHPRAHQMMDNYGSWDPEQSKPSWMEAHNVVLNIAGQTGFVGIAVFLAFYGWVIRDLWRCAKGDDIRGWMSRALLAGHLGALAFHGWFAAVEDSRQVWFLLGLSLAVPHLRLPDGRRPSAPQTAARPGT